MTFSEIYEKANVRRLPVDPIKIAEALGVKVVTYKAAVEFFELDLTELYALFPLGFSFKADSGACIALNENSCGERRRRFTAAHELGHCVLGHLSDEYSAEEERAAERFAAELLAPLVILREKGVRSAEEIARLCGISRQAAELRLEELALREKSGFESNEDETRIKELFAEFINAFRS